MSERAAVFEIAQLGVESTPGTTPAGGADKKLLATEFIISPEREINAYRPQGMKYATIAAANKQWAGGKFSGVASYNDLVYLLAAILGTPTPAQQEATTAYKSTFTPDSDGEDSITSYYIQNGSSVRAHSANYCIFPEVGLSFSRDGVEVSGTIIGQAFTDDATLTASPTEIPQMPILPEDVSIYMDSAAAGLGSTKLTRVLKADWKISNKFAPLWVLNASNESWAVPVEGVPTAQLQMTMEADSVGMGLLTQADAGTSRFIRIEAVGPLIETTYYYTLTLDLCGKISDVSELGSQENVVAVTWTFDIAHDSTWTKAMNLELINTVSAL